MRAIQNTDEKPAPRRIRLLDVVLETAREKVGERTLKALLVLEERPTNRDIAAAWAKFGQSSVKLRLNESGEKLMLCCSITNAFRGRDAWDTYPLQWLQDKAEDALSRFNASRAMTNPLPLVLQRAAEWLRYREQQEEAALRSRIPTVLGVHLID